MAGQNPAVVLQGAGKPKSPQSVFYIISGLRFCLQMAALKELQERGITRKSPPTKSCPFNDSLSSQELEQASFPFMGSQLLSTFHAFIGIFSPHQAKLFFFWFTTVFFKKPWEVPQVYRDHLGCLLAQRPARLLLEIVVYIICVLLSLHSKQLVVYETVKYFCLETKINNILPNYKNKAKNLSGDLIWPTVSSFWCLL